MENLRKISLFGSNWFLRRMNSYNYLRDVSKGKINFLFNFDYLITKIIFKVLNLFNK